MSEKLKACPFCGGEAEEWTSVPGLHAEIGCAKCKASMEEWSGDMVLARERWNRRATPPSEGERVREAADTMARCIEGLLDGDRNIDLLGVLTEYHEAKAALSTTQEKP